LFVRHKSWYIVVSLGRCSLFPSRVGLRTYQHPCRMNINYWKLNGAPQAALTDCPGIRSQLLRLHGSLVYPQSVTHTNSRLRYTSSLEAARGGFNSCCSFENTFSNTEKFDCDLTCYYCSGILHATFSSCSPPDLNSVVNNLMFCVHVK